MTTCHIRPRGTPRIPLIYKDSNHTALSSNTLFTSTEPWHGGRGGLYLPSCPSLIVNTIWSMRRHRNSTSSSAQRSFSARRIWSWGYSWLMRRSVTNQTREHILDARLYGKKEISGCKHTHKAVWRRLQLREVLGVGRQWSSTEMVTQWGPGRLAAGARLRCG